MMQMLVPQTIAHPMQFMQAMEMDGINHYAPQRTRRKRKAEWQPDNNERLSKRLSLLNLERNGTKLYVPVENPAAKSSPAPSLTAAAATTAAASSFSSPSSSSPPGENDTMQLDDSKYKVYIYNLDDELSSESEPEDGKLVFLPDIEKHLRKHSILPSQLLAGASGAEDGAGMELVLYSVPSSISVPEERDSVRKAIIETRARMREKQQAEHGGTSAPWITSAPIPSSPTGSAGVPAMPDVANGFHTMQPVFPLASPIPGGESDAMDLD